MADIRTYPELVKSTPDAPLMANLDPEHAVLGAEKPHTIPQEHEIQAIKVFIEGVENLYEEDYGDWMREVNAHLLDLMDTLKTSGPEISGKLAQMQHYLQFNPTWEIEPTCKKILADANAILQTEVGPTPPLNPS